MSFAKSAFAPRPVFTAEKRTHPVQGERSFNLDDWPKRFTSKFVVDPSGCWLWQAATNRWGYGVFGFNNRPVQAHRHAWNLAGRDLVQGLHLHHRCEVPGCVNPDHLEPLSPTDHAGVHASTRTHCKNGHEFTPENTGRKANGTRRCLACQKTYQARHQPKANERHRLRRREAREQRGAVS